MLLLHNNVVLAQARNNYYGMPMTLHVLLMNQRSGRQDHGVEDSEYVVALLCDSNVRSVCLRSRW